MAQAYITRRGGGAALRLDILTAATVAALPASAADGALAMISTVAAGKVTLDAAEPAAPAAGDVWLKLGYHGRAALPLCERPLVRAYPFTAAQFAGGAWAFVRAFVYHGGWLELRAWLYDMGDAHPENGGAWAVDYIEGTYGSVTFGTAYIAVARTIAGARTSVKKADSIDFTPFTTLRVLIRKTSTGTTGTVSLRVMNGTTTEALLTATDWTQNEERTLSLDVSGVNAERALKIFVTDSSTFRIYQAWLE
jgi:hypothetical protein